MLSPWTLEKVLLYVAWRTWLRFQPPPKWSAFATAADSTSAPSIFASCRLTAPDTLLILTTSSKISTRACRTTPCAMACDGEGEGQLKRASKLFSHAPGMHAPSPADCSSHTNIFAREGVVSFALGKPVRPRR